MPYEEFRETSFDVDVDALDGRLCARTVCVVIAVDDQLHFVRESGVEAAHDGPLARRRLGHDARPSLVTCADGKKGKVFPYSLPSVGPGADPGVQAVSPRVT